MVPAPHCDARTPRRQCGQRNAATDLSRGIPTPDCAEDTDRPRTKRPEGELSAYELLPTPGRRPFHRPIVIIAITMALWVRYDWPALQHAREWEELGLLTLFPIAFIGLVGRHLPTRLLERRDRWEEHRRKIAVALASPDGPETIADPSIDLSDLRADRNATLPEFLRQGPGLVDEIQGALLSLPDGSWKYQTQTPANDAWMRPGFDDSGWRPMLARAFPKPDETDGYATSRIHHIETLGGQGLGIQGAANLLLVRRVFTLEPS